MSEYKRVSPGTPKPNCIVDGCGELAIDNKYKMCSLHKQRVKAHGDPHTKKKPTNGEAMKYLREVVLEYEGDECLIWPFFRKENGYGQVRHNGKATLASFAVCEMVHGPRPSKRHQAAHSCGKGHEGCVTKGHLSWKTRKQNAKDKIEHGTHNGGSNNHWAKLTDEQASTILRLKGKGPATEIAKQFGVAAVTVRRIWRKETWKQARRLAPAKMATLEAA